MELLSIFFFVIYLLLQPQLGICNTLIWNTFQRHNLFLKKWNLYRSLTAGQDVEMTGVDWFVKPSFLSAWICFNCFPFPVGFVLRFNVRAGIKFYSLGILDSQSFKVKMEMNSLLRKINFLLLLHVSLHPLHRLLLAETSFVHRCTPVLPPHTLSW